MRFEMSIDGDLVRWEPDFNRDELGQVEQIKRDIETRVSVFRDLRTKLGMSQSEFAKLLGRSQSNISKLESRTEDTRLAIMQEVIRKRGGRLKLILETAEGETYELTGS